ncbi:MAG: hypothetical protein MZU95_11640 [Desulfomicrobium escambiense]|nr:hypothetical protein [Desulfomicrobium escambiense]
MRAQEVSRYVESGLFDSGAHRQGLDPGKRVRCGGGCRPHLLQGHLHARQVGPGRGRESPPSGHSKT